MTEQPIIPPKTEDKTIPPAKTEEKTTPPTENEADVVLTEMRDEYKKNVSEEQWDAVKNLSIAKQVKLLKVMQPKAAPPPTNSDPAKPDIKTPLDSPAPIFHQIKDHVDRWNAGERDPKSNSTISVTLFPKS